MDTGGFTRLGAEELNAVLDTGNGVHQVLSGTAYFTVEEGQGLFLPVARTPLMGRQ